MEKEEKSAHYVMESYAAEKERGGCHSAAIINYYYY